MLYIDNNNTNPYFNLAAEEYILKEFKEDCFMLWRDAPCIVVGKNQNTISEINIDYVKENDIPVVRRLSGGGTVFHDLGNLNFTFIDGSGSDSFNNFKKFTEPVIEVLRLIDVPAEFSGRNDITIEGKKFSGNAQYSYRNRVLHHGTLLFSSSITDLSAALKVKPIKFEDKSVKSVASRVTNISSHLKKPLTIMEFKELIQNHVLSTKNIDSLYEFTETDVKNINRLVEEKYSTWEWNFGSSPKYNLANEKKLPCGNVEFNMEVEKGMIRNIRIYGDFFSRRDIGELEQVLSGIRHREEDLRAALSGMRLEDYLINTTIEDILSVII